MSIKKTTLDDLLPFFSYLTLTSDAMGQMHHDRTAIIADRLADALECDEVLKRRIRVASMVHDIGKIAIHDTILFKHGRYTEAERAMMETHPVVSANFLRLLANAGVHVEESVITIVIQHHENWDGTGYPYHLRKDRIHLGARILRIADFYEAVTTQNRSYRTILKSSEALDLMRVEKHCFDPKLFSAFLGLDLKGL